MVSIAQLIDEFDMGIVYVLHAVMKKHLEKTHLDNRDGKSCNSATMGMSLTLTIVKTKKGYHVYTCKWLLFVSLQ